MINWAVERGVAIVVINNPPLNASNHAVRSGLVAAIREIEERPDIKGIVLTGAGANFVAGSDIREFGAPLAEPQMPDVILALERCRLPVVAAIRGACLGGGFELALGCDYRFAAPDAVLGLPEVGLGIVPGAGGTQKLPRLCGIPDALDLIVTARRVTAAEGLRLGMVDALVETDLMEAALSHAASGLPKRRITEMPVPDADAGTVVALRDTLLRRARHRPAAVQATELVLLSPTVRIEEGLAEERRVFQEIRVSPEAFALRHVFFAERAASKLQSQERPADIRRVAVIGGGTMGAGIAYTMLKSGCSVALIERDLAACAVAQARVDTLSRDEAKRGLIDEASAAGINARFSVHASISAVSGADLVIEAVFEDMEIKQSLLEALIPHVADTTLIATNTSYLDIDVMAKCVPTPSRFFGFHFFSPVHRMSLVEIVQGAATDTQTLASAFRFARRLGKQPVLAGNAHGFVGNRIYAAYCRHAEYALQDGARISDIDAAMRAFGMAMGPFEVADLSGLDIAWRMRKALGRVAGQRYVDIPDRLCEAGRLGRKTGAGYYRYEDGRKRVDPDVEAVVAASRQAAGISARTLTESDIQRRLLGAILVEAAKLLSEGIAQRAGDIDVALIHGYGFPRWTGGPLYWASQLPRAELEALMASVEQAEAVPVPGDLVFRTLEKSA